MKDCYESILKKYKVYDFEYDSVDGEQAHRVLIFSHDFESCEKQFKDILIGCFGTIDYSGIRVKEIHKKQWEKEKMGEDYFFGQPMNFNEFIILMDYNEIEMPYYFDVSEYI